MEAGGVVTVAAYGGFYYGAAYYGAGAGAAYPWQGEQANAKQDTRYLAQSQATDLGQYATNLTASGTYAAYEVASSRAALSAQWTLEHRADYDYSAHTTKIILAHADDAGTSYTYRIRCGASGIECAVNGTLIYTAGVKTGVVDRTIAWAMRANPDTTGAGDAKISEFSVYDHDGGDWELDPVQVAHAAPTTSTAYHLTTHGQWDNGVGALNSEFPVTLAAVRISCAFHSHVEVCEDWCSARASITTTAKVYREPLPIDVASGMSDEGEIVGPQLAYLCDHQRNVITRGFSPLVNEILSSPTAWKNTYEPANKMRKVSGTQLRMPLPYLRWCAVPHNCNYLYARVNVRSYVTAGAAVPVKVAVVSMNFPNGVPLNLANDNEPAPAHERYYGTATITVDHGASPAVGEWVDLGRIKLARNTTGAPGWWGSTFLALAYLVDPLGVSANDANARLQFLAWHVRPLSEDPEDNGLAADQVMPNG